MDWVSNYISELRHLFSERASPRQSAQIIKQLEDLTGDYLYNIQENMNEFSHRINEIYNETNLWFKAYRDPQIVKAMKSYTNSNPNHPFMVFLSYGADKQNPFLTVKCLDYWLYGLVDEKNKLTRQVNEWLDKTIRQLNREIERGGIINPQAKLASIENFLYRIMDDKPLLKSILYTSSSSYAPRSPSPPERRRGFFERGSPPRRRSVSPPSRGFFNRGSPRRSSVSPPRGFFSRRSPVQGSPRRKLPIFTFKRWAGESFADILNILWSRCFDSGADAWNYWEQNKEYYEDEYANLFNRSAPPPPRKPRWSPPPPPPPPKRKPRWSPPPPPKRKPRSPSPPKSKLPLSKDCYKILEIPINADKNEIMKAWRRRSKQTHPDKGGSVELQQQVNIAHDILSDPRKRQFYDTHIRPQNICVGAESMMQQMGFQ